MRSSGRAPQDRVEIALAGGDHAQTLLRVLGPFGLGDNLHEVIASASVAS